MEAIRAILNEEVVTWNHGDPVGYSKHFAADGTFTNVRSMLFSGHQAYRDHHEKGAPPDLHLDTKGRLRTGLLQLFAKRGGEWQIVVYHNVDIKPDVETPEPE